MATRTDRTVGMDFDADVTPARRDPWRNHSPSLNGTRLRLHLEQLHRLAIKLNPRDYKGVLNNIKSSIQRILSGRRIIRNGDDAFTELGRHLIASQPEHPDLKPFVDKYNWHTMHDKLSLDEMIHAHLGKIVDNHLGLTPDRLLIAAGGDKNRDKLIPHLKKALKGQAVISKPITDSHIRDSLLRLRDGAQDRVLRGVHLRPDPIPVRATAKALKFAKPPIALPVRVIDKMPRQKINAGSDTVQVAPEPQVAVAQRKSFSSVPRHHDFTRQPKPGRRERQDGMPNPDDMYEPRPQEGMFHHPETKEPILWAIRNNTAHLRTSGGVQKSVALPTGNRPSSETEQEHPILKAIYHAQKSGIKHIIDAGVHGLVKAAIAAI